MLIFLVRHAPAVDPSGRRDEDRPLTTEGRFRMRRVVQVLHNSTHERFDQIITSPYVRAVQTAEILAVLPGFSGEVEVSRLLLPMSPPKDTMALFQGQGNLALVGHEPGISALASELMGRLVPPFIKGSIWLLSRPYPGQPAEFCWAVLPQSGDVIRSLEELETK